MKAERRVARRDHALTPGDGARMDLDAVVAAAQEVNQSEREIADPGADVEHAMFRAQAASRELSARPFRGAKESRRVPRAIVVDAEMRGREQRAAVPADNPIDWRCDPMKASPCPTGHPPPRWPRVRGVRSGHRGI